MPLMENFPFYLSIVVAIVLLVMLATRIKVAYPILLVVAGLLLSFIPGIPSIGMHPELIFVIFLPPLLYEAAWNISWKELWHWRRIIGSFAFLVVFITALSVALVANAIIPGFTLALGFLLGGIISPPDAVSAGAVMKFVKLPRTLSSILEGESLLNDASSLIIFRFALVAVATGQFFWTNAAISFVWMVIGGVGIGLLVGFLFIKLHRYLPTDATMDIMLTLVTPYVMYLAAEAAHSSGILAVVSGGLLLSDRQHSFLTSSSRLKGYNVWESLVFILNGLIFIMIGLSLPQITAGLEGVTLSDAIVYGLLISAVLIVGRILIAYGAVLFTMFASHFITVADTRPGWRGPFVLGWAGMRGVVSLAAAMSIPITLSDGTPFPQRNLILFITFIVILTTLLLQGLTLPAVIRVFGLDKTHDAEAEATWEETIRKGLARNGLEAFEKDYSGQYQKSLFLQQIADKWQGKLNDRPEAVCSPEAKTIYMEVLHQQRQWLLRLNLENALLDEQLVRQHLHRIDIEEERIKNL